MIQNFLKKGKLFRYGSYGLILVLILSFLGVKFFIDYRSQREDCLKKVQLLSREFFLSEEDCQFNFRLNYKLTRVSLKSLERLENRRDARVKVYQKSKERYQLEKEINQNLNLVSYQFRLDRLDKNDFKKSNLVQKTKLVQKSTNSLKLERSHFKKRFQKALEDNKNFLESLQDFNQKSEEERKIYEEALLYFEEDIDSPEKATLAIQNYQNVKLANHSLHQELNKIRKEKEGSVSPFRKRPEIDLVKAKQNKEKIQEQRSPLQTFEKVDCENQKCVALTFDDGPSFWQTPRLLDILRENEIKATFYVLGSLVEKNPSILSRMEREGHEIGNHTWNHPNFLSVGTNYAQEEIIRTNSIIFQTIGKYPATYRAPYGALDEELIQNLAMPAVNWTVDPLDWKYKDSKKVQEAILKDVKLGHIILLHDVHGTSVDATPIVIEELKKQDYVFVTVSQLLDSAEDPSQIPTTYIHRRQ